MKPIQEMSVCAHAPPSTLLELNQHTNKVVENLQVLVCGGLPHGLDQNWNETKYKLTDFPRQAQHCQSVPELFLPYRSQVIRKRYNYDNFQISAGRMHCQYVNIIQRKQHTRFSKTFICHVWRPSYLQFCGSEKFRHTGLMLMTVDTCDAAGYENPKPLFVEKGNVYPQPMRRRQLWGLRSAFITIAEKVFTK